jgi:uncharacterized protein
MSRPVKCRKVAFNPEIIYFKPAGIPLRELDEVELTIEELEALRLKDIEGLEQEQGAEQMNISRSTFQRILCSARRKTAEALLQGKAIRIGGGTYELTARRYRCTNAHEWEAGLNSRGADQLINCPVCHSNEFTEIKPSLAEKIDGGGCGLRRGLCSRPADAEVVNQPVKEII